MVNSFKQAKEEWEIAKQGLEWAEKEFVALAAMELAVKAEKLNLILRKAKQEGVKSW